MHTFLERAYRTRLRLSRTADLPRAGVAPLIHARTEVGPLAIEDIHLAGDLVVASDPISRVFIVWATAGRLSAASDGLIGEAAAGEITMMAQTDRPYTARVCDDSHVTSVLMNPSLLARAAGSLPVGDVEPPLRFLSFRPVDSAAERLWKSTVTYVKDMLVDYMHATPLVLGHVSRLLAAVALATFPNTATADPDSRETTTYRPALLHQAIDFIEANVTNDIDLTDIAEALHVTPRAVQYLFRHHLESTPMQYLRRRRLHHAHQELVGGDQLHTTVAAIAAKWGFPVKARISVNDDRSSEGRDAATAAAEHPAPRNPAPTRAHETADQLHQDAADLHHRATELRERAGPTRGAEALSRRATEPTGRTDES